MIANRPPTWRLTLVLSLLAVWAGFGATIAAADDTPTTSIQQFRSVAGGVTLDVPATWHVKELPGEQLYQAFLSREKVEKQGDLYTFGVSITRYRNYRDAFKFTSSSPASMALEFANRIAAGMSKGGQSIVISMPGSISGMNSYKYYIGVNGGTEECLGMSLVVGIKGKAWFHALWEIPCKERVAHESEVDAMIRSLKVDTKWGSAGE